MNDGYAGHTWPEVVPDFGGLSGNGHRLTHLRREQIAVMARRAREWAEEIARTCPRDDLGIMPREYQLLKRLADVCEQLNSGANQPR